jgi:Tfp pilus assembly PilM family ATPase
MNDITSTEKLLDIIRENKKESPPAATADKTPLPLPPKKIKLAFPGKTSIQKNITVGVDIGHDFLRLVKTTKSSDKNRWKLLDYQTIPLNRLTRKGTPEFLDFLKSEITRFCGSYQKINIWAIMSAANVNVRHIRIPKVAKNEIENFVFWSIKKEAPFNKKETLLDIEILEEITEQGAPKWFVMAYTAPNREIEEIKNLFSKIGLPLTGISIVPFAVQNIFRTGWLPMLDGTVASLFIGNDFSRIDIYSKGTLVMTRGIKAGINSMVESLLEVLLEQTQGATDAAKEKTPVISMEQARKVLFSLSPDSKALTERDAGYHLTEEEKLQIVLPALGRLVRQIDRTFEYYSQAQVSKIFVTTAMNIYQPLIAYVGEQLGIESDILNPFDRNLSGIDGNIQTDNLSERVALTPALGMALSEKTHTPNLLFTYKDKQRQTKMTLINVGVFALLAVVAIISVGVFLYGLGINNIKKSDVSRLQKQLTQFQPNVNKSDILQLAVKAKQQKYTSGAYSERYRSMAVIGELSALTPTHIRLINLKADFGTLLPDKTKEPAKETQKQPAGGKMGNLVVDGVIFGNRQTLESSLAGYIMNLQASPIFQQISIQKNSVERIKKRDVLRFTINMKIL